MRAHIVIIGAGISGLTAAITIGEGVDKLIAAGETIARPIRVAFRQRNDVGTQNEGTFAAQWLAYALPCQRFANTLAGICA